MFAWSERKLPEQHRRSTGYAIRVGTRKLHVAVGYYPDGSPCEIRVATSNARVGSELWVALEVWSRTASLGMQYGLSLSELADKLVGVQDGTGGALDADGSLNVRPKALSVWDGIGQVLLAADKAESDTDGSTR